MDVKSRKYPYFSYGIHLLLCIVTLGVWQYIWIYRTTNFLNDAHNTEKRDATIELLLCMFVPFYSVYWFYKHGVKTEALLADKGFKASSIHIICMILAIFLPTLVPIAVLQSKIDYVYDERSTFTYKKLLAIIKFDKWKGWIYLSPAIVMLLIFTVWPIINTIRISLLEGYNSMAWVGGANFNIGFGNFKRVLIDPASGFMTCLTNTMFLCFVTVPISTFLALLIAVCLNSIKPLQRFLQTIFFMPYVTNSIAIGMVFAAMFNMIIGGSVRPDSVGIVNNVLEFFGFNYINWINAESEWWANMVVLVVYIVWNALPFKILILLGGLQSVNKQYYDAAKVDGTSRVRVFTRITVPLLSPMLAYVVITGFIGGFKEYSSIVGIFGDSMGPTGQPYTLDTMVGFIYRSLANQEGTASAAALILFGIIFVVTMINLYVSKKRTHY